MLYYHRKHFHAGPQLVVAVVWEHFWPLCYRNLARRVVHACTKCFRCKPKVLEQLMGELPSERGCKPTFSFVRTGVDYCGSFFYRPTRRATKCYMPVFVCLATKAVHLECVADPITNSFMAALWRFECDNALNFQGAKRELEELARLFRSQQHKDQVSRSCSDDGITFKFIPPRPPNFGGLWEAAVKPLKPICVELWEKIPSPGQILEYLNPN
ncbi:uncharacterized protein LOC134289729 [Aedes albopictus]|uniref:Integrase zinc-binding domain-containing protein n=1 Tax=Aedes albopictus TaxID=7160 RepID=A0ABM1YBB9_AEDAL